MYEHIIREALQTPWALTPRYLALVQDLLRFRASGGRLSAEEVRARVDAADERPKPAQGGGAIAVVPIHGLIMHRSFEASSGMTSTEQIGAMLQRTLADEEVSTVLLDICSPGGTVVGVPELAAEIFAARKRKYIVALVNGEMCSAAHFLGSQANEIVSIPSGYCGSIGVYAMTEDWSEYLAKEGIKINFIHAGDEKCEGSRFWEPLSDEARERLQSEVDRLYAQFLAAVAKGRESTASAVKKAYAGGRVFNAKEALELGMIDRIATVPETLTRLAGPPRRRAAMSTDAPALESLALQREHLERQRAALD